MEIPPHNPDQLKMFREHRGGYIAHHYIFPKVIEIEFLRPEGVCEHDTFAESLEDIPPPNEAA